MTISELRPVGFTVVLLTDLSDLASIKLDSMRSLPDVKLGMHSNSVVVVTPGVSAEFKSKRIEFKIEPELINDPQKAGEGIGAFFQHLPEMAVDAIGTNYHALISLGDTEDIGRYITENFISSRDRFETALGGKVFGSSVRVFSGERSSYRDLRVALVDFENKNCLVQLHIHEDASKMRRDEIPKGISERLVSEKSVLRSTMEKL